MFVGEAVGVTATGVAKAATGLAKIASKYGDEAGKYLSEIGDELHMKPMVMTLMAWLLQSLKHRHDY